MDNYLLEFYRKFLLNKISQDEFREFRYHLNKMDNEEFGLLLEKTWENGCPCEEISEKSRQSIKDQLDFYIEETNMQSRKKRILLLTAVFISFLIVGVTLFAVKMSQSDSGSYIVSVESGNKAALVLPDGSRAHVNANSTLEYSDSKDDVREVKLIGEAFFKVAKERKRPFKIIVDGIELEVLGTSFNVKARKESAVIEASLVEGSIKISSEHLLHDVYLKPNEKVIYNKKDKGVQIVETDNVLETAWVYNRLQFSSERFEDVLKDIGQWYGVTIVSRYEQINDDLISGSFNEENLQTALSALSVQYKMRYVRHNDTIYVYKK